MRTRRVGVEEKLQPCHPNSKLRTRNWPSRPDGNHDGDDDDDDDDNGDDDDGDDDDGDMTMVMMINSHLYIASESPFSIVSSSSCQINLRILKLNCFV